MLHVFKRSHNTHIMFIFGQCMQWRIYIVKFWTRAPPLGPKFFQFHAVFWENLAKSYVGAPLGSWCPLLGEILDPPLVCLSQCMLIEPQNFFCKKNPLDFHFNTRNHFRDELLHLLSMPGCLQLSRMFICSK